MKIPITLAIVLLLASSGLGAARPNIVFMLADDQGWNGTSVAMDPDVPSSKAVVIHTPNLEHLAADGMIFAQAYAPAPVCSPTRISLQLGKSPATLHWTKAAPPVTGQKLVEPNLIKSIPENQKTIGDVLRSAGYATAHYGKWHIAGGGPERHGYDQSDGETGNEHAYQFKDPNPVDIFGMADRAERFMAESAKAGKPFYVQLSWNALHASENALATSLAKYEKLMPGENAKRVTTAAISEDLDAGVGKILAAIDRLGLRDNTYVIYMSDNGGNTGRRGPLHGGKGGLWEGGIRVPLIVRGPGVDPGSCCRVPVVGYDLFPTFCQWAHVDPTRVPGGIEGGTLAAIMANSGRGKVSRPAEGLVFHFPHYQDDDGPQSAILLGRLKLIHFYEDDRIALFDLSNDLGERDNLASQMPDEARRLRDQLDGCLAAVAAQMPTPNRNYDPTNPGEPSPKRGGRRGAGAKRTQGTAP